MNIFNDVTGIEVNIQGNKDLLPYHEEYGEERRVVAYFIFVTTYNIIKRGGSK
jgi:hypothetical protein